MEIGLLAAFLGGVLTILSPCSVMLLPAFFSYAFSSSSALVQRTGVFYLGLITPLVPLGMLAGSLGAFVNLHRQTFVVIASWIVIVLGIVMIAGLPIPSLRRNDSTAGTSNAAVYALGTVYGLAGTCAGPLLGAVLTYAAFGGNAILGGLTLLVFGAGMVVPLLILALLWNRLPFVQKMVRPREITFGPCRNTWTSVIGGAVTIGLGVLLLMTEGTTSLGGILGASEQARVESSVMRISDSVPNAVVIVIALLVLAAVWVTSRHRKRKAPIEVSRLTSGGLNDSASSD